MDLVLLNDTKMYLILLPKALYYNNMNVSF